MKIIRFHCDGCGQFISKGKVITLVDSHSGFRGHYHAECARDVSKGRPVYAQQILTV